MHCTEDDHLDLLGLKVSYKQGQEHFLIFLIEYVKSDPISY